MEKRTEFLAYARPLIEDDDISGVVEVLRGDWLSKGPKTAEFEREFAKFVGAKHAVAMNSATAALHVGLMARDIGPGDEVITTPMTFVASANVILHVGARPVFVDINPYTLNIDHTQIRAAITERTKAVIPVHIAGLPCDMDQIRTIARERDLFILDDAAHGVYGQYKGGMIGSLGDATAFSFYPTKNMVTTEGGMLTTSDEELANKARIISLHGMSRNAWNRYSAAGSWYYEILYPGFKYNMTDVQASLGLTQLKKLDRMQATRERYAAMYNEAFSECPELEVPAQNPNSRHAWHLYIIKLNLDRLRIGRNQVIEELKARNIGTSVHFIPVHFHPLYRERFGYERGMFPNAEAAFDRIISLPLYPKMSAEDVRDVIAALRDIVDRNRIE